MKLSEERLARLRRALESRFGFENFIGKGGSASVFKVRNLTLDRVEALKVLDDTESEDEDFGQRFANEARVAASLDHPGIVKVYDSGEVEGIFWFTMQFVAGPTLSQLMSKNGAMPQNQIARLAVPLLDAFDYSHDRGVIHRDIKPSNIIIDTRGRPHLLDYGIAKAADSMLQTRTGLILGTPAYVAPEQASLAKLDGRADLYSLGVTLYEALTGTHHFTADNPLQSVVMRMTDDPEPLLKKRPDLDPGFAAIIMRALARDPDQRFASAADMRDALIPFVGDRWGTDTGNATATRGIELPLPPVDVGDQSQRIDATRDPDPSTETRPYRSGRVVRRWLPWAIGVLATAVVLAVVLTLGEWPWRGGEHETFGTAPIATETTDLSTTADEAGPSTVPDETAGSEATPTATTEPTAIPATTPRTTVANPVPPPRRPVIPPRPKENSSVHLPGTIPAICADQVVNLSVVVGEDGRVVSTRVISASSPECGEIAATAVITLEYEPALAADQQPVESTIAIAIPFKEMSE